MIPWNDVTLGYGISKLSHIETGLWVFGEPLNRNAS